MLRRVLEFWRKYGYFDIPYERLVCILTKHLEYKTIEIIEKDNEIIACCAYNVSGEDVTDIQALVKPEYENKKLLKLMLIRGIKKFPFAKYLVYERGLKDKKIRRLEIKRFLGI